MATVQRVNLKNIGDKDATLNQAELAEVKKQFGAGAPLEIYYDDGEKRARGLMYADFAALQAAMGNKEIALNADADAPQPPLTAYESQRADTLPKEMDELFKQLQEAETAKNDERIKELKEQLAVKVREAHVLQSRGATKLNSADLGKYAKAAGVGNGDGHDAGSRMKASVTSGGSQPGGASGPGGQMAAQTVGTGPASVFPPAGWGATNWMGPQFNSGAYLQSIQVTDNIMSSWDQVSQNTNRGKQLMMLFFYFAKMAESGDMGAMYQFMKFITYIVSKDKAKQQIEMGKKLIQLQDLSRQWTNKLLNLQTSSTDPNTSNELMKTMTIVKSETDAIATSQKLISQMMEEFAQVVETLTNTTKSALETAGRIQRTVSRFSA